MSRRDSRSVSGMARTPAPARSAAGMGRSARSIQFRRLLETHIPRRSSTPHGFSEGNRTAPSRRGCVHLMEQVLMRVQSHPGTRIVVAACSVLLLASVSAFAQSAQSAQPAPPAQAPVPSAQPAAPGTLAPTGPVRPLSVDEAVKLALEQNLGIQVERLNPELQEIAIQQARTAWRPGLTAGMSAQSQDAPPSSFLSGASDKISSTSTGGNVGVVQLLPWGTSYSV